MYGQQHRTLTRTEAATSPLAPAESWGSVTMARMARAPTTRVPASMTRDVTSPSERARLTRRATG